MIHGIGGIAAGRKRGSVLVDPATRSSHLFSWGGYRTEQFTFTEPVSLNTFSTLDDGLGAYAATIGTIGSAPHGLISGRSFVLKRSNGSTIPLLSYSVPSTSTITITTATQYTDIAGATVESESQRVASYTNPGAWGGTASKSILASRPELETVGGLKGLRGDALRFMKFGPFDGAVLAAAGGVTAVAVYAGETTGDNASRYHWGLQAATSSSSLFYHQNTGASEVLNTRGRPFVAATESSVSNEAFAIPYDGDPWVAQGRDIDVGGGNHQVSALLSHPNGTSSGVISGAAVSGTMEWLSDMYITLLGNYNSGSSMMYLASLDIMAGDRFDDPDLFAWLAEMQPGPTYPS